MATELLPDDTTTHRFGAASHPPGEPRGRLGHGGSLPHGGRREHLDLARADSLDGLRQRQRLRRDRAGLARCHDHVGGHAGHPFHLGSPDVRGRLVRDDRGGAHAGRQARERKPVNQAGGGTFLQNTNARVKAVNGIVGSANVNFKVDNAPILVNVPFAAGSNYVTTASGSHTLQVEQSNVPGTNVATLPVTLASARDYSALAMGTLAAGTLVTFQDDNSLPATGFCKLRFVNGLSDGTAVDVQVNFATQVSQLPSGNASTYFQVAPSTTYTFTYSTGGGVQVIGTLTPIELDSPGIYTSYIVGTVANAKIIVLRER